MRYRKLEGFASIRADEPEHALEAVKNELKEKAAQGAIEFSIKGAKENVVTASPENTIAELVEKAGGAADGAEVKAVHFGLPLGALIPASQFDRKIEDFLYSEPELAGSAEAAVLSVNNCVVDYMLKTVAELREESCGRCVLCRMALQQLGWIFDDAVNGRGRADDKDTVAEIAGAMKLGAHCPFGKAAGVLIKDYVENFTAEFEEHTKKKACAAGVCKKYMTYHILGSKCTGCGDCMDVCDQDCIEGKKGYIHMIDTFDCTGCGKCIEECEEEAIIIAGAKKPKTPDKLTKVGKWRKDY